MSESRGVDPAQAIDKVPNGQEYFVYSYILPNKNQKEFAFKFRGAYPTVEDCKKASSKLMEYDDSSAIFATQSGHWFVIKDEQEVEDDYVNGKIEKIFDDERLTKIMQRYETQQLKKKQMFEARKKSLIEAEKDPEKVDVKVSYENVIKELNFAKSQVEFYTDYLERNYGEKIKEID